MVMIDTPGIHRGHNRLGRTMTDMAVRTLKEVDVVLFLVDSSLEDGPGDKMILDMLRQVKTPKILVINKIDKMEPERYLKIYNEYDETGIFTEIYGTSALESRNVPELRDAIEEILEEGPMYFPDDLITDYPERFLVTEVVREKALLYLNDEVPHGIAAAVESFEEDDRIIHIGVVLYCEKKSHKGIIIGKQGRKLKGIGKAAREELETLLGKKIFLEIWVKVRENWRDSASALEEFGYLERE
jgi:GTP-binding protein Era